MVGKSKLRSYGVWLTDATVPQAKPVWATRYGRFGSRLVPVWMPSEETMWLDLITGLIYYAEAGIDLTDFASTPVGDGAKGILRGCGRLHDLMDLNTPILIPDSMAAVDRVLALYADCKFLRGEKAWLTLAEVLDCGYIKGVQQETIWTAGGVYYRMLMSAGFSPFRAFLHRFGLRGLGLQYLYRWAYAGSKFEYLKDREHRLL